MESSFLTGRSVASSIQTHVDTHVYTHAQDIVLVRESLGKVTMVKDLYLALASLKSLAERRAPDPAALQMYINKVEV
jgi:hypothetical protein